MYYSSSLLFALLLAPLLVTASLSNFNYIPGWDYPGNDLGSQSFSLTNCANWCLSVSSCVGFVTDAASTYCWLKSSFQNAVPNSNRLSYQSNLIAYTPILNYDYPGNDLVNLQVNPITCAYNCIKTANCVGFVTDTAGTQCWLKSGMKNLVSNSNRKSYLSFPYAFAGQNGEDYPGNDLGSLPLSPVGCAAWCRTVSNCAGFVLATDGSGTCWIKSALQNAGPNSARYTFSYFRAEFTAIVGTDYPGYDIASLSPLSPNDCAAWCDSTAGCTAFIVDNTGTICWLKTALVNAVGNSNRVSYRFGTNGGQTISAAIIGDVVSAANAVTNSLNSITSGVNSGVNAVTGGVNAVTGGVNAVTGGVNSGVNAVTGGANAVSNGVTEGANDIASGLESIFGSQKGNRAKDMKQDGGFGHMPGEKVKGSNQQHPASKQKNRSPTKI